MFHTFLNRFNLLEVPVEVHVSSLKMFEVVPCCAYIQLFNIFQPSQPGASVASNLATKSWKNNPVIVRRSDISKVKTNISRYAAMC